MTSRCSTVIPGEYACDFYEFGCRFAADDEDSWTGHYQSSEARHDHVRLLSEELRKLRERVQKLESDNKDLRTQVEQYRREIERLQTHVGHLETQQEESRQEIQQNRAEMEELKRKITQLETEKRLRVCSTWELSRADLELPAAIASWEEFQCDPHSYAFAVASVLSQTSDGLRFQFNLRLQSTPHDRSLQWPFNGRIHVEVFPPDGFEQLRPQTCAVSVETLTAEQQRLLRRPSVGSESEERRASIEVLHPAGFTADQLQLVPADAKFLFRFSVLL